MPGDTSRNERAPSASRDAFRYRKLAGEIERRILDGIYQPGEKLPSIRRLHQQTNLSISTRLSSLRGTGNHGRCRSPAKIRLLCAARFVAKTGGPGFQQKIIRAPAGQSGARDQLRRRGHQQSPVRPAR